MTLWRASAIATIALAVLASRLSSGEIAERIAATVEFHPADGEARHELYLMCDDIGATLAELRSKGAEIAQEVSDQGWGLLAAIRLPDGSEFPVYQPRHPLPPRT